MAAVSVVPAILDYVDDEVIRKQLLPRARSVHSTAAADVKIVLSLLACISKVAVPLVGTESCDTRPTFIFRFLIN